MALDTCATNVWTVGGVMEDSSERRVLFHGRCWVVEEEALSEPSRREFRFLLADDPSALPAVCVSWAPLEALSADDVLRLLQVALRQETKLLAAFGERWEVRLNGRESKSEGALLLGVDFRCRRTGRTVLGSIPEQNHTPARMNAEKLRSCLGSALQVGRSRRA